ncbi:MAG TPA: UDP-3-O-[3-hydroxymyristoyl] N-acetylglucosamine deacetylase [Alphaproteobacteria bacterium]|nr:UDP-3-O-[3-hydroxymyristoyl] N-acetylglucosamine deacetylase [Alphaproteobacteria bacterium]
MDNCQTTLRNRIGCSGIGLHTGQQVRLTIFPAAAGTGIVFRRVDLCAPADVNNDAVRVPAHYENVSSTQLGSTLRNEAGVTVATVEHLMSAFSGCGIDNALVDIDGPELPVLDGSAAPFVMLLECAGIAKLPVPRRFIRVLETVRVEEEGKSASLSPCDGAVFGFEIDFDCAVIGRQSYLYDAGTQAYKTEIAPARTFGFLHEVEHLQSVGLARGGSLQNAVVLDGNGVLNTEGLRFEDEFVRHKILDAIGDLYLSGARIIGRFDGYRAGHGLHYKLLQALFANPVAWEYSDGLAPALPVSTLPLRRAARG